MPRRKLIRQSKFPYHVTIRTNHKSWFQIPMYEVWDICKNALIYALSNCPVEINCFLLMSNHYHMIVTTPDENIDRFMMLFNLKLSKLISKSSKLINHKFSNRYKWTIIDHKGYLLNAYRYIYQNPIRAKMTRDCKSYPYSSLHFSNFESKMFNYKPHINYAAERRWLEKSFGDDFNTVIRKSLSKSKFRTSTKVSSYHKKILAAPERYAGTFGDIKDLGAK